MAGQVIQNPANYSMASLYVGDLHPNVSEAILFDKFSSMGAVMSIRVCRDSATRSSLGYAYVNFQQPADAERAMDTMNFETLHGKPMRIMWSQRDPAVRRSGAGNIFIKNLDKKIDNKSIYDTFSLFGSILSCKVATDEEGNSKGYGFVHFETEEAAQVAIEKVNGMLLADKKVYVGKFKPRSQRLRELGGTPKRFTNVYVKNFGDRLDKESLEKLFAKYGKITSCAVMTGEDGASKGFGFVAFAEAEDAEKAVAALHDSTLEGSDLKLYVARAQKKAERQAELKKKHEQIKAERIQRYQGVNLYVKNLDETIDDEKLEQAFKKFGTITSHKVMLDESGRSKGFGFVCFEDSNNATCAISEMAGKMLGSKPLYVALAQRKEDRRAELATNYMTRLATMRLHSSVAPMYNANQAAPGYYIPSNVQQRVYPNRQRWGYPNAYPVQQFGVAGQQYNQQRQRQPAQQGAPRGQAQPYSQVAQPRVGQPQNMGRQQARQAPSAPKGTPQTYNTPQDRNQGIVVVGQEPLTSEMLAAADPQEQKQLLGERIYALIEAMIPRPKDAGKITGMMLEIDNSELIMMLQDTTLFRQKVDEAAAVLESAPK